MPHFTKAEKKANYFASLKDLLTTCPKVLIINVDMVGSKQLADVRIALRGRAQILMGKNTMIRTVLRGMIEQNPDAGYDKLLALIKGNIGFVFCQSIDMNDARKQILEFKVNASAKAGTMAPVDVKLFAGPTGLDPSQTSFFQALNIATKIVKGSIEMVSDVHLIKAGLRVQASEQVLLQKLSMKPFVYAIKVQYVFDEGSCYDAEILDITDDVLAQKFMSIAQDVAAVSLALGVPTAASFPHMLINGLKNLAALVGEVDYSFEEVEKMKAFIKDPSAFAGAAGPASAAPAAGAAPAKAAAKEASEEEEEEAAFDLFG